MEFKCTLDKRLYYKIFGIQVLLAPGEIHKYKTHDSIYIGINNRIFEIMILPLQVGFSEYLDDEEEWSFTFSPLTIYAWLYKKDYRWNTFIHTKEFT